MIPCHLAPLAALFTEHQPWAAGIARRVHQSLPPSFDLDDLVQEAYLETWRRLQMWQPERNPNFQGYAARAVRGAVLMRVRRRHYAEATHEELDGDRMARLSDPHSSPERISEEERERRCEQARLRRQRRRLRAMISQLPLMEGYLVSRVYLDGVSPAELADLWRVDRQYITRRVGNAIRRLKQGRSGNIL